MAASDAAGDPGDPEGLAVEPDGSGAGDGAVPAGDGEGDAEAGAPEAGAAEAGTAEGVGSLRSGPGRNATAATSTAAVRSMPAKKARITGMADRIAGGYQYHAAGAPRGATD